MPGDTKSINWLEIPVIDLQRAKHFYQVAFNVNMNKTEMNGEVMMTLPYARGSHLVSGAFVFKCQSKPGGEGVLAYLNAEPSIQDVLERAREEGAE